MARISTGIIVIIWSITLTSLAQSPTIDSLKTILLSDVSDSIRLNTIGYLAWTYNSYNIDSALYYAHQQIALSRKKQNVLQESRGYLNLMTTYRHRGASLDTLLFVFEQGMKLVEAIPFKDKMKATMKFNNQLGLIYKRFGAIDKAFVAYKKALDIAEATEDKDKCAHLINLSAILRMKTDYQKALDYVFQAYYCTIQTKDEQVTSAACDHIGYTFHLMNKKDSALVYYFKGLKIKRKRKDKIRIINTLGNIGAIYREKKHFEIATNYILEALDMAYDLNQPHYLMDVFLQLGRLKHDEKKYREAIRYDEKAMTILGENSDRELLLPTLIRLKESYKKIGKYQQALMYQEKYNALQDSIFTIEKERQINELETQYQVAKKENENQLLKAKQLTDSKTIRSQRAVTAAIFFAFLLAGSWGLVIYRSNQRKKKLNALLEKTVAERTMELQKANDNLEQANYELRTFNYIASHDIKEPIRNIGSYASLIFRKLPKPLKENLGDYFSTIKKSTTQLYTLVEDFAHYTTLSKDAVIDKQPIDLNQLIQNLNENMQEILKKTDGRIINLGLPTIQSSYYLIYTVLKNLVENGLKFNQSPIPTVELSFRETAKHYEILVKDNGVGIEAAYQEKIFEMFKRLHHREAYEGSGIGLAIVKLSMNKLNGIVRVKSEVGKGSCFVLTILKVQPT